MVKQNQALSPQQKKLYQYLRDSFYAGGSMPTYRELCKYMGWSAVGTAQSMIQALIDKGFLDKDPQRSRGLSLAEQESFRVIPILGSAPAGTPVESLEQHLGNVSLPDFIRGPVFAVRVMGESMKEAGIHDGDIVIVRQSPDAEHREIVVAVVEGEVTIKRLIRRQSQIWLQPENSRFKAFRVEDPHFRILGKVIGLHRYWERI